MTAIVFGTKTIELSREFKVGQRLIRVEDRKVETKEVDSGEVENKTEIIVHPTRLVVKTSTGDRILGVIEVSDEGIFKTKTGSHDLSQGLTEDVRAALVSAF